MSEIYTLNTNTVSCMLRSEVGGKVSLWTHALTDGQTHGPTETPKTCLPIQCGWGIKMGKLKI